MDKQTEKYLLNLVKRNYEEIAADFDLTRKKQLWPELLRLTEPVKNGDRVLDVGCGNGRLLEAFGEKKISYLGVDNSEKLIETARKNFQFSIFNFQTNPNFQFSNKIQNTRPYQNASPTESSARSGADGFWRGTFGRAKYKFQVADILQLDKLPERNFAYVFCIAVLHHLPGENLRIKALEQMKNKINKNGQIILTVWNLWKQAKFRKLIFKYGLLKLIGKNKMDWDDILFNWKNNLGQPVSRRYYHTFTKKELKKLAVRAGLKIEKLSKDKYNYYAVLTK
ncbi:MAG: class I SAM-dependent methyltransferase [Parcubacteria group bacterium]|nr:class I SAM-dependent methyltransferase [Parcubacteria group bacterium]